MYILIYIVPLVICMPTFYLKKQSKSPHYDLMYLAHDFYIALHVSDGAKMRMVMVT